MRTLMIGLALELASWVVQTFFRRAFQNLASKIEARVEAYADRFTRWVVPGARAPA